MPDQKTIDLIGQEVHTPNHAQIYEKKKQCEKLDKELEEKKKLITMNLKLNLSQNLL